MLWHVCSMCGVYDGVCCRACMCCMCSVYDVWWMVCDVRVLCDNSVKCVMHVCAVRSVYSAYGMCTYYTYSVCVWHAGVYAVSSYSV